jgi:hypothetical protein
VRRSWATLAIISRWSAIWRCSRLDALGHVGEGIGQGAHFVTAGRQVHRSGAGFSAVGRGCGCADAPVAAQPLRQPVQRQRQAPEGEPAEHEGGCQAECRGHGRAPPQPPRADLRRHGVARGAVEHDVQVAGRPHVTGPHRKHRRAEDARRGRSHGVGAEQRQFGAGQKSLDRAQVDLVLLHHAGLADVVLHAAVGVEQVDLHARVHRHQHRQQCTARRALGVVAVGRGDLGPVPDDVPGQAMRQPLLRLQLLLCGHPLPEQRHEGAIRQQQQGQRQRQPGREGTWAHHGAGSGSKR